jgi:hypothetical protein
MPEVGQNPQATLFQISGLGILILVDEILFSTFLHQAAGLGLHPGANEGGQIEPGVAIEEQMVVDELIGPIPAHPVLWEGVLRKIGG